MRSFILNWLGGLLYKLISFWLKWNLNQQFLCFLEWQIYHLKNFATFTNISYLEELDSQRTSQKSYTSVWKPQETMIWTNVLKSENLKSRVSSIFILIAKFKLKHTWNLIRGMLSFSKVWKDIICSTLLLTGHLIWL